MRTTSTLRSGKFAQALAAALLVASAGMASAYAAETTAPSKAMCEKEAKSQGLTGEKEKAFVDQCMHGGMHGQQQ